MKRAAYIAFCPPIYRTSNYLCIILFMILGFLASYHMGNAGITFVASGIPLVLVFLDYFAFSGTSTRKQKIMCYIKTSFKGKELYKNALITDLYVKEICILSGFFGFVLKEVIVFDAESFRNTLMCILIFLPISELTLRISLLISRRLSLAMGLHLAICYLSSMITLILLLVYSFLIPENISEFALIVIVLFAVLEAVSILIAIIVYRDGIKGYESGFYDI